MRKLHKLFGFFCLLFIFSCYSSRIPTEVLDYIEHEDDNLCQLEGLEFKDKDTKLIYWTCRLRVINQRIDGEFDTYGYDTLYRREFKRLRRIIKNRIKEQKRLAIAEINSSLEEKEYNYCILLKNKYTEKQGYDYFKCREDLAKLRTKDYDFSDMSNEYLMDIFEFYDENEKEGSSSITFVHKDCVKYAKDATKLKKCEGLIGDIDKCQADIEYSIINRRIDDKIFCTKSSINQYPDSLATFDKQKTDAASFGPKMEKLDLVDLRAKAYDKCYRERTLKVAHYREYLENQCRVKNLRTMEEKD